MFLGWGRVFLRQGGQDPVPEKNRALRVSRSARRRVVKTHTVRAQERARPWYMDFSRVSYVPATVRAVKCRYFSGMRNFVKLSLVPIALIALSSLCVLNASAQGSPKAKPPASSATHQTRIMSAEDIARDYLPGVVTLLCEDGANASQGSGFFVRPGVVATNLHVVQFRQRGGVLLGDAQQSTEPTWWVAEVLAVDEKADLALLSVPEAAQSSLPRIPLASASASLRVGERIYALGSPLGLSGSISEGIVSANPRSDGDTSFIQISAPISHGSSGGPVVNERGEVIGVAVGSTEGGQNLNFAVPVSKLVALLRTIDQPKRDTARPVGPLQHAWRATPAIARAMGLNADGSANASAVAAANAADSMDDSDEVPSLSNNDYILVGPSLAEIKATAQYHLDQDASLSGLRLTGVGTNCQPGKCILTVTEVGSGVSASSCREFFFYAPQCAKTGEIRGNIAKYRDYEVLLVFKVIWGGNPVAIGAVSEIHWLDKTGKMVAFVTFEGT